MIVGLTGVARSGKDTAARILVERHGYTRLAFADKLKELAEEIDPVLFNDDFQVIRLSDVLYVDHDEPVWEYAKELPDVRQYLQDLGTSCRRILGDDVWIRALDTEHYDTVYDAIAGGWYGDSNIVISDVRYENEAKWIRALGGKIVRVTRPGVGPVNDHASESGIPDSLVSIELDNRGSISDLELLIERGLMPRLSI